MIISSYHRFHEGFSYQVLDQIAPQALWRYHKERLQDLKSPSEYWHRDIKENILYTLCNYCCLGDTIWWTVREFIISLNLLSNKSCWKQKIDHVYLIMVHSLKWMWYYILRMEIPHYCPKKWLQKWL